MRDNPKRTLWRRLEAGSTGRQRPARVPMPPMGRPPTRGRSPTSRRRRRLRAAVVGILILVPSLTFGVAALLFLACVCLWWRYCAPAAHMRLLRNVELAGRYADAGDLTTSARLLEHAAYADDPIIGPYARAALATIYMRRGLPGQALWLAAMQRENARRSRPHLRNVLRWARAHTIALADTTGATDRVADMLCTGTSTTGTDFGRHSVRVASLLRALNHWRRFGNRAPDSTMSALLFAARPTHASEYDYLHDDWPDLRAFQQEYAHALAPAPNRVRPVLPCARVRRPVSTHG